MKKVILIIIIATLCSCSKQYKAEHLVSNYLAQKLNDPKSYEKISFGTLDTIFNNMYEIKHTYRSRNEFGGVVTKTEYFHIDSSMTKIDCCYIGKENRK